MGQHLMQWPGVLRGGCTLGVERWQQQLQVRELPVRVYSVLYSEYAIPMHRLAKQNMKKKSKK
jgi:hypothetical protein